MVLEENNLLGSGIIRESEWESGNLGRGRMGNEESQTRMSMKKTE